MREGTIGSLEGRLVPSPPHETSDWRDQKETAVAVSADANRGWLGCTDIDHMASPAESGPATNGYEIFKL